MTAYLRPGDKVHVAFPIPPGLSVEEGRRVAQERSDGLIEGYARQGVKVVVIDACDVLTHVVVVAVFREEK